MSIVNAAIAKHYLLDDQYIISPFEAKNFWDKKVSIVDHADKVVVLDFWATWCGPCINQEPHLQKLALSIENDDLLFIKVSIDKDIEKWRKYMANSMSSNILQWHIPIDKIENFKSRFSITSLPRYMLLGFDNKVLVDKMPKPESGVFNELILQALKIESSVHHSLPIDRSQE